MNKKTLLIILVAVSLGYLFGKSKDKPISNYTSTSYFPPSVSSSDSSLQNENDELKFKLDRAREMAEESVRASEDLEDRAMMRAITTGSFEDMQKHIDAEESADRAREVRDSLDR